jgi:heavy metal sensor kinase
MKWSTLRGRVVTWYVGLLAAALIVFGATLYFGVQSYLRSTLQDGLIDQAKAIGTTFLAFEEQKGPAWMGGEISEAYAPEVSGRFIRITRQDGKVIYQSGDTRDPLINTDTIPPPTFERDSGWFRTERQPGATNLLVYAYPFRSSTGTRYFIETGTSLASLERMLTSLLDIVLIIMPFILLAATLGGQAMMKLPLQPLVTLTERAEHIGTSKLGERLPVIDTGDEMERLSLSLNRMISRLEDALSHNQRFSADVSHELRTPLTIMRGELEHALVDPDMAPSTRDSIGSALEEISRMAKIVESLLAIARLDSGADAIDPHPEDISKLCRWVMEQMHLLAEEKHISMSVHTLPMIVSIDPARMKQVLVNLIDNAIKYTPDGGSISLNSFVVGRLAVIQVTDNGIGIPASALPNVFDRFYRTDKARSRVSGGTGLGLAIVKAICHAHGGSVTLTSSEGAGTLVRIELPLAAGAPASPSPATSARPSPVEVAAD